MVNTGGNPVPLALGGLIYWMCPQLGTKYIQCTYSKQSGRIQLFLDVLKCIVESNLLALTDVIVLNTMKMCINLKFCPKSRWVHYVMHTFSYSDISQIVQTTVYVLQ